jgi:DNA-binding CsgD family transcriptional regulator
MMVVDLVRQAIVDANAGARRVLGVPEGVPVAPDHPISLREQHRHLADLLATGDLDAFEGRLRPRGVGGARRLRVWVRALRDGERRFAVAVAVEDTEARLSDVVPLPNARVRLAAGATGDDWRCEWVTSDVVGLLAYEPDQLVGTPLLGLAHPSVAANLVEALTHASADEGGAVLVVRLRGGDDTWRELRMIVAPRPGGHAGVSFLLLPLGEQGDIGRQLADLADELHVAGLARDGGWPNGLPQLSSRQWEILTRLRRGERVPGIAQAMYLSQSTIRNHLSEMFRKFGVHSQAELLLEVRRRLGESSGPSTGW